MTIYKQTFMRFFIVCFIIFSALSLNCDKKPPVESNGTETLMDPPEVLWTKTFGGEEYNEGYAVEQTDDGGYILLGNSQESNQTLGDCDIWLIKTNESGETLWTKTFGAVGNDIGYTVQQTSEGGFIITGFTKSYSPGDSDVWLIHTDGSGSTLWTKTFRKRDCNAGYSVEQTRDGGYIITGSTGCNSGNEDIWLIRTDTSGDTLWTKTFGGSESDIGYSVKQIADDGFIILGKSDSYGTRNDNTWLIRTDEAGDTLWTKVFERSYFSIQRTSGSGYIMAGHACLLKTDATGDELWFKSYEPDDIVIGYYAFYVQLTSDGGYIMVGTYLSFDYFDNGWLFRTDGSGNLLWSKGLGGFYPDFCRSVQETSDKGYIVAGDTNYDIWLVRFAADEVED